VTRAKLTRAGCEEFKNALPRCAFLHD
jgi:hypothetical protein